MEWISITCERKPKHGQKVLAMQDPDTTATTEALFAIYNNTTRRFMPPERFNNTIDEDGFHFMGWADIIYWMPLPPIKYQRGKKY